MPWPSATEALVLHKVLELGESHGLDIARAGDFKRGGIYVVLGRLEAKGFVESRQEPLHTALTPASDGYIGIPRRLYKATLLGEAFREALKALFDPTPPSPHPNPFFPGLIRALNL